MSFDDFCQYFTTINVCHVPNTKTLSIRKTWRAACHNGFWKLGSSAGGCINNKESFFTNPQVYGNEISRLNSQGLERGTKPLAPVVYYFISTPFVVKLLNARCIVNVIGA